MDSILFTQKPRKKWQIIPIQRETIQFHGVFGFLAPLMERMLLKAVEARLEGIKVLLESRPAGKQ